MFATDQARNLAFQIASELRNGQSGANGAYVLDTAADQQIDALVYELYGLMPEEIALVEGTR